MWSNRWNAFDKYLKCLTNQDKAKGNVDCLGGLSLACNQALIPACRRSWSASWSSFCWSRKAPSTSLASWFVCRLCCRWDCCACWTEDLGSWHRAGYFAVALAKTACRYLHVNHLVHSAGQFGSCLHCWHLHQPCPILFRCYWQNQHLNLPCLF